MSDARIIKYRLPQLPDPPSVVTEGSVESGQVAVFNDATGRKISGGVAVAAISGLVPVKDATTFQKLVVVIDGGEKYLAFEGEPIPAPWVPA